MSQCPSQCHTCRAKIREERKEELRIRACRMGPMPQLVEEEEGDTEQDVVVDFLYISLYMHPIRPQLWSPIVKTSLLTTTCKKNCAFIANKTTIL